ncbi:hypothetical protein GIB67_030540 [Kingdonia uniflora]|uniref:Protein kinase domain-containing protein n=1 Tax=Kingdonia uniflora TaxID=39325 RepID=A0A7J7L514_9MAGN|nr:hypothetical protein GIB67_030540 [Kingdonia uniflora]
MASQNVRTRNNEHSYMRELARLPKEFSYEDLKAATNNFRLEEKLGSGGSGSVFKGILKDGSLVAVKRVELAEYGKQVFEAEISTIASVRHVHLVRLRGYCSHVTEMGGAFFVIYDLLPNGSLDTWIFPGTGGASGRFLSWKLRYKVAIEVARALVYLHQDCCPHILHLDIKPENILLDEKLRAVLSDFGLSKLTNEDEDEVHTKMIRGTAGYMAPEWFMGNLISDKCDIYSYGKVLLDLFFGQRYVCLDQNGEDIYIKRGNSALEQRTFHAFMWDKLTQPNLAHLIDKRLMDDGKVDELEAKSLIHVALCCLDEDPKKRPVDMRQVLRMLEAGKQDETGAMVDIFAREFSIEKTEKAHESGTPSGSDLLHEGTRSGGDLLPERNPSSADCGHLLSEGTPSGGALLPEGTPSLADCGPLLSEATPSGGTSLPEGTLTLANCGASLPEGTQLAGCELLLPEGTPIPDCGTFPSEATPSDGASLPEGTPSLGDCGLLLSEVTPSGGTSLSEGTLSLADSGGSEGTLYEGTLYEGTPSLAGCEPLLPEGTPIPDCGTFLSEATPFVDGVTLNPEEIPSDGGIIVVIIRCARDLNSPMRYSNAEYSFDGGRHSTEYCKTRNPNWNYERKFVLDTSIIGGKLHVQVFGHKWDFTGRLQLGSVTFSLLDLEKKAIKGWFRLNDEDGSPAGGSIYIKLRYWRPKQ